MRFLAILISALASISAASTETWQQSVVGLFKEMCVVPDKPTAIMAAGERLASARDWKLDQEKSGRTSFIFILLARLEARDLHQPPDPNDKPFFVTRIWEFSFPTAASIKALILIAGPEYPDVRYTYCGFVMPGSVVEDVAFAIQQVLGSSVIAPPKPKPNGSRNWLLSQDGTTVENCRKVISLSSYHPKTDTILAFVEMHFPDTWGPISQTSFC